MAANDKDQTTYANQETGEIPIASKPDIIRENPYGKDVPVPGSNVLTVPETTITGRPIDPTIAANLNPPGYTPPSGPLSQQAYNQYQIESGEGRKETVAQEATNLSRGQQDLARINHEAWLQQTQMVEGNPEKLKEAQQQLMAAQALPPNDPSRASQVASAQQNVMMNEGARPALMRAMADANRRDEELRAQIRAAQAQKIDPDRWWNSKSTEGKILAGIGMVLGGIGGGLAKTGRNPAMDVMNNAISQDIDAQKHDIDNHWKSIAAQHGLDNDAFNRDLHRQVWENNYRTSALETVKFRLAESAAKTNSETVKNNATNMIQDINDQQMKIRNDQWRLAVAAQQAEIERMRKLAIRYSDQVKDYATKEGVDFDQAQRAVGQLPEFSPLINNPRYAPQWAAQDAAARNQFLEFARRYKAADPKLSDNDALNMAKRYQFQQTRDALQKANPGVDPAQIEQAAQQSVDKQFNNSFGTGKTGMVVPPKKEGGAETQEQLLGRTVLLDGKPVPTVNKKAADDWKEYSDAKGEADRLLQVMKASQPSTLYGEGGGSGDPAKYEAARAKMIEILPKIYGFNRGPTQAQVKLTFGPEAIPEYVHWYSPAIRSRAETKLNELEGTLNQIDKSVRASTFPQSTGQTQSPTTAGGKPVEYDPKTRQPLPSK